MYSHVKLGITARENNGNCQQGNDTFIIRPNRALNDVRVRGELDLYLRRMELYETDTLYAAELAGCM